jgi:hypothetical protein
MGHIYPTKEIKHELCYRWLYLVKIRECCSGQACDYRPLRLHRHIWTLDTVWSTHTLEPHAVSKAQGNVHIPHGASPPRHRVMIIITWILYVICLSCLTSARQAEQEHSKSCVVSTRIASHLVGTPRINVQLVCLGVLQRVCGCDFCDVSDTVSGRQSGTKLWSMYRYSLPYYTWGPIDPSTWTRRQSDWKWRHFHDRFFLKTAAAKWYR